MQKTYSNPIYDYVRSPDQDAASPVHHPVIIVGGGPCGMAAALDLSMQGISCVLLDDNNTVSVGSRAICFAKRTLEIVDRLGCAERMVNKGITWQHGKVFFQADLIYDFDLLPESDHKLPAFINLQQYYFEEYMVDRIAEIPSIDLRWLNKVTDVSVTNDQAMVTVQTEQGDYQMTCDYLLVADGPSSEIRTHFGLESKGQVFQDRFLIADITMKAKFPTERWFWFDPPFHKNQSALLHRQADDVWRIDLQLGWDADPEEEKKEENIRPRLEAMLGKDIEFELEWASVYTFQCRKMDNFRHQGRVFFIGDAAHQVSPFGARGANGGIQSVENLAWKLGYTLRGEAPDALLDTYNTERQQGAAENIANSTRATDFITPKNAISRVFRDETLRLAKHHPFARTLVNSGRLSIPCNYVDSPLISKDEDPFEQGVAPGYTCKDAPLKLQNLSDDTDNKTIDNRWLMNQLGNQFTCMVNIDVEPNQQQDLHNALTQLQDQLKQVKLLLVSHRENSNFEHLKNLNPEQAKGVIDHKGLIQSRYNLQPGSSYLIRPDQIVCGRWKKVDTHKINKALLCALGFELENTAGISQ